mmetsp:Transcript_77781/g.220435  ORF Transcript_77781/g.220435 Transcript_77781/m.220435 type:complete len:212 (-) Transcript_77781:1974-2609(-)
MDQGENDASRGHCEDADDETLQWGCSCYAGEVKDFHVQGEQRNPIQDMSHGIWPFHLREHRHDTQLLDDGHAHAECQGEQQEGVAPLRRALQVYVHIHGGEECDRASTEHEQGDPASAVPSAGHAGAIRRHPRAHHAVRARDTLASRGAHLARRAAHAAGHPRSTPEHGQRIVCGEEARRQLDVMTAFADQTSLLIIAAILTLAVGSWPRS